jgi:hypothetical protein
MSLNLLLSHMLRTLGLAARPGAKATCAENQCRSFARDRYDPDDLLKQFAQQQPRWLIETWEWELEAEIGEIVITLPDAGGTPSPTAHGFLVEVLRHLRELDNLVQTSCEAECARTLLNPANYELALGWVTLLEENLSEQIVTLSYYGVSVNTCWDAKFQRDAAGAWRSMNFLSPLAAAPC